MAKSKVSKCKSAPYILSRKNDCIILNNGNITQNLKELELKVKSDSDISCIKCSRKKIDIEAAKIISKILDSGSIKSLKLNKCEVDDECLELIFKSSAAKYLQEINIGGNKISEKGALKLAKFLKDNEVLEDFNISNNSIGAKAACAIITSLKSSKLLKKLNITNTQSGDEAVMKALSDYIKHSDITYLSVSSNNISDHLLKAFAMSFASGFNHDHSDVAIKELYLDNNAISNDGVEPIKTILLHFNELEKISVNFNNIGDDGIQSLSEFLPEKSSLNTISLAFNPIGNKGVKTLADKIPYTNIKHSPICMHTISHNIKDQYDAVINYNKYCSIKSANSGANSIARCKSEEITTTPVRFELEDDPSVELSGDKLLDNIGYF